MSTSLPHDLLEPREKRILRWRFGIGTNGEMTWKRTLGDVSEITGLTRERVRMLEFQALEKLVRWALEATQDSDKEAGK